MRYTILKKQDKLNLLKLTDNTKKVKELDIQLKTLIKSKNIKSLRQFQDTTQLYNFLHPQQEPEKTTYDILLNQIEKSDYQSKTKYDYTKFISKLKNYNESLNDSDKLIKFISDNYTLNSAIKVLNLIVNHHKNNEIKHKFFYNARDNIYKELKGNDKGEIFKGNGVQDYNKIIDNLDNTNWKLIFILLVNYPNLRISDYHSIKIKPDDKNIDNYITPDFKQIIFNKLVKVNTDNKDKITIDLKPQDQELFKKVLLDDYKYNYIHPNLKLDSFKKHLNRLSHKLFGIQPSAFRKLNYQDPKIKEGIKKLHDIAQKQNHSVKTSMQYYT